MRYSFILTAFAILPFCLSHQALLADESLTATQSKVTTQLITDFTETDVKTRWKTVNDNVMGGRSKGGPAFDGKQLVFSGSTNTNGGGFSSIRTSPGKIDGKPFINAEQVILRVRGDGRTHIFAIRTDVRFGRMAAAYWHKFKTEKDKWMEIRLPLKDFYPTFFGKDVSRRVPALDLMQVKSIGFMMYDKKDGPFKLEVDWIKVASRAESEALPPM